VTRKRLPSRITCNGLLRKYLRAYDEAMWAASLSDIFNAILDRIGGLFFSLWHADIPTPNEEIMAFIAAFILIVVAAFIGYRMILDTREYFVQFWAKHGWFDRSVKMIAAFICISIGLVAGGFIVFLVYLLNNYFLP
jgi:hypothetical protein